MAQKALLSAKELARLDTIPRVVRGELRVSEASCLLSLCAKQVWRWVARYEIDGIEGLLSRHRGKRAGNRIGDTLETQIVAIYRKELEGYGPKHAAEVLADEYAIKISREKLRQILIKNGMWTPGTKPSERVRARRRRSSCRGHLVQIDGSVHQWLDGQDTTCLLTFVDDATSEVLHLHLTTAEDTISYLAALAGYLKRHGRPLQVYADGHTSLFGGARKTGNGMGQDDQPKFPSQFARALKELHIVPIRAFSPQARGRVERMHRTLKGRFPQFLKRRGASTLEAANSLVGAFLDGFNGKFAIRPASPDNKHRALTDEYDLDRILSVRDTRIVARGLVVSHNGARYVLEDLPVARGLVNCAVAVETHLDGRVTIRHDDDDLPFWIMNEAIRYH